MSIPLQRDQTGRRRFVHGAGACLVLVLTVVAGCGTTGPGASRSDPEAPTIRYDAREVEGRLRAAERRWRGTPYRWGGTSRDGVDCSAFVMRMYRDLFDLTVPRTTSEQVQTGRPVTARAFQAGDLLFFRPSGKARHVGIYLGDEEFVHASTSEGVTISRLDDPYWQTAYWTTRRILPAAPSDGPLLSPAEPDAPRPSPRRVGW